MEEKSQQDDSELDETFFCDKINLKMFAVQRAAEGSPWRWKKLSRLMTSNQTENLASTKENPLFIQNPAFHRKWTEKELWKLNDYSHCDGRGSFDEKKILGASGADKKLIKQKMKLFSVGKSKFVMQILNFHMLKTSPSSIETLHPETFKLISELNLHKHLTIKFRNLKSEFWEYLKQ